ncbi:hypothetical protein DFH09DRAFT_1082606 [Mycena vulgaris]|nr:hypothetical protein DFH09DRAFT_1082606 [Mycena vulgaris]
MSSEAPSPDAQALAAALAAVKEAWGFTYIGFCLATAVYGIGLLQGYFYFRNYQKDNIWLKLTVLILLRALPIKVPAVDTAGSMLMAFMLYDHLVTHFGDVAHGGILTGLKTLPRRVLLLWTCFGIDQKPIGNGHCYGTMVLATDSTSNYGSDITFAAGSMYAFQIWRISQNRIATGSILFLSLAGFGKCEYLRHRALVFDLPFASHGYQFNAVASLGTRLVKTTTGLVQGTSALCDILITSTLIYYLHSNRVKAVRSTEKIIDTLILYIITRGMLTAAIQCAYLIIVTFISGLHYNVTFPTKVYWQPLREISGKLYVNSVLASLNFRNAVRGRGQPEKSSRYGLTEIVTGNSAPEGSTVVFTTPKPTTDSESRASARDEEYGMELASDHASSLAIPWLTQGLTLLQKLGSF